MKTLQYILGLPPYRTGGSIKYCVDVMKTLQSHGNDVACLWPGKITSYKATPRIKRRSDFDGIASYELVNPLPVPLDEGITDVEAYTRETDKAVFVQFLKEYAPDLVHIHTLMGLPAEFIDAAKELGIKVIVTSHDYFGLCPKVTFNFNGHNCDMNADCTNCERCNATALGLRSIQLLQSPLYRRMKETALVKKMRKHHRADFFGEEHEEQVGSEPSQKYIDLRQFYINMLSKVDFIHFNSTVPEEIYRKFVPDVSGEVVPISHSNISDNRKYRTYGDFLRIIYLAPLKPFKGYYLLKSVLDDMWNDGRRDFELHVYSGDVDDIPYAVKHDSFTYDKLSEIFDCGDVLIAPSICYETFGFTVLEALSYGVPAIVSSTVGAKDLINGYGMVFESGNKGELRKAIESLNSETLSAYNKAIVDSFEPYELYDKVRYVYDKVVQQ